MTKRHFGLSRKTETRQPLKRFVIFAEGKNTEPAYFAALGARLSKVLVHVEVLGGEGDPKTLGKKAIDFRRGYSNGRRRDISSFERNDEVWIVFDCDEHHKVKETIDNSRKAGVKVGYSNPCFEIWLILHFQDFQKVVDRHEVQKHFGKLCVTYSAKGDKKPDCSAFVGNSSIAEKRAIGMRRRREDEGEPLGVPYTDVDLLTSALRKANEEGAA